MRSLCKFLMVAKLREIDRLSKGLKNYFFNYRQSRKVNCAGKKERSGKKKNSRICPRKEPVLFWYLLSGKS